jgi:hypothetical protein
MPEVEVLARAVSGTSGKNGRATFAEADTRVTGEFAGTSEDDLVTVGEEGADLSGGKFERLSSVAGEFQETASGGFGGSGDGAGGEDVANLEVAAVARVMGDELGRSPIEVLRIGLAQHKWIELIVPHRFS